jgi:hypothetical protein
VTDLEKKLLAEHSKAQCERIVQWVSNDQERFDELFGLFLNGAHRVVQHAAWPISYCVIAHPGLIKKHWKKLVGNLHKPNIHNAVKRNSLRLLQDIEIPEAYEGEIMDICFAFAGSPTEAIAVKAFALTVLGNLAKKYPDIIPELKVLIEDNMPHATPAFKSRAKKLLKEFNKE